MIGLNCSAGYHPLIPVYDIATFKSAVLPMFGSGSWRLRHSGNGADWVGKVKLAKVFCFAMETRESERHFLGNKDYPPEREVPPC